MKHVGPTRVELGTRTMFNLLGPLQPGRRARQLLGVFSPALGRAGRRSAGARRRPGHAPSTARTASTRSRPPARASCRRSRAATSRASRSPRRMPACRAPPADLKGADPAAQRRRAARPARRRATPYRDVALLNAAAALIVAGRPRRSRGRALAAQQIDQRPRRGGARKARRGFERLSRCPTSSTRIESYKREEIAAAKTLRPLDEVVRQAPSGAAAARFLAALEAQARRGPPGADRRGQEGEPVQGPDPRRLQPARDRPRL